LRYLYLQYRCVPTAVYGFRQLCGYSRYMPTKLRNVRVSDEVWAAAKTRAEAERRSLTDVIVAALTAYGAGATASLEPKPPARASQSQAARPAPVAARSKACDHAYPDVRTVMGKRICQKCD
jgi:hypothetical protein